MEHSHTSSVTRAQSDSLVIEIPGRKFRLVLDGSVAAALQASVFESALALTGADVGGVLFGRLVDSDNSAPAIDVSHVEIFNWGADTRLGTRKRLRLIQEKCGLGRRNLLAPIGFGRSTSDATMTLTPADAAIAERLFPGRYSVFLLMRRASVNSIVAAVFVRTPEGSLPLVHPAVRVEMSPGHVAVLPTADGQPVEVSPQPAAGPSPITANQLLPPASSRRRSSAFAGFSVGVILLGLGGGAYWSRQSRMAVVQALPESLHIERDGADVRATWNSTAALFQGARGAAIVIRDGADVKDVPLDLRLKTGLILYTPKSDDVEFQLFIYGQTERTESVRVVGMRTGAHSTSWASISSPQPSDEPEAAAPAVVRPSGRAVEARQLRAGSPVPPPTGKAQRIGAWTAQREAQQTSSPRKFVPPPSKAVLSQSPELPSAPEIGLTPQRSRSVVDLRLPVRPPSPFETQTAPDHPQEHAPDVLPPQTTADQPTNLSGTAPAESSVVPPVPTHKVLPSLPSSYRSQHRKAAVTVLVQVTRAGSVSSARIASSTASDKWLDGLVLQAAQQWKFTPGMVHGKAVNSEVKVTFDISSGSGQ